MAKARGTFQNLSFESANVQGIWRLLSAGLPLLSCAMRYGLIASLCPVVRAVWLAMGLSALNVMSAPSSTGGEGHSSTNSLAKLRPNLPLNRVSSGLLMLLDRDGDLVRWPAANRSASGAQANVTDPGIVAGLDPRVGLNLQLGPDPSALPSNQRAQAEPHIARDPLNPDTLVATFQEGRYADIDGGAIDCGYSVTHDGGLSWTRAVIPLLTQVSGGPYYRATDPVAGVDLAGNIYLNTLGALDRVFSTAAVVVSRSTNGGITFDPPVEIFHQTSGNLSPDKNWLAINTFAQTTNAGLMLVTWTMFTSGASPIASSYSDDGGRSWSPYAYATPPSYACQGSQPLFLPDGTVALVYWNFGSTFTGGNAIELVSSTNSGATFSVPRLITPATEYNVPGIRQGAFLPSAATDRTNGILCVVYQTLYQNAPRIMFTRSADKGATWTTPRPISDNPANAPVFNPAVSLSPDGQEVTVIFYDERVHPAQTNLVDIFLAQSLDGGNTWQPNLRLTTVSSDITLAPLTTEGYMLGDYQAVAPCQPPDLPAVPVWIDTRSGNPDPFIARVGIASQVTFPSWRAARFNLSQIADPAMGGPGGDPDGDGVVNVLEYALGLNPWQKDQPVSNFEFTGSGRSGHFSATYELLSTASDLSYGWLSSPDFTNWTSVLPSAMLVTSNSPVQTETVTSSFGPASNASQFYRLTVQLNN